MKKVFISLLLFFGLMHSALACKPAKPSLSRYNSQKPVIVPSSNHRFFLKLMPSKWASEKGALVKKREAYAIAYELRENGQLAQLWSYKNWDKNLKSWGRQGYPELYLSNDGKVLTEVNRDSIGIADRTAIIIYKGGKVSNAYSPSNLGVKQIGKHSCGYGNWAKYNVYRANAPAAYSVPMSVVTTLGKSWKIDLNKGYLR